MRSHEPPLIDRTFLILDFGLDIVGGVAALDLEGYGLPRQGLDEDLHLAGTTNRALARYT